MSIFSLPDDLVTDAGPMETMLKSWSDTVNAGVLAAPVFGTPAAAAAVGAGAVAQAWGTWCGAVHGFAAASHRLPSIDTALVPPGLFFDDNDGQVFAMYWPFGYAAGAVRTMVAEMERTVRDVLEVSEHVTEEIAEDAELVTSEIEHLAGGGDRAAFEPSESVPGHAQPDGPAEQGGEQETVGAASDLLPEDFVAPTREERPAEPDDLTMIGGIGPKLAATLNDLGVWTFAQIAAWTPAEAAWVDDTLSFKGRVERDAWIEQATVFSRGGREEYVKVFGKEPS